MRLMFMRVNSRCAQQARPSPERVGGLTVARCELRAGVAAAELAYKH